MKIVEHKVDHGELLIQARDKIFSFGIDNGTVYFWATQAEKQKNDPPDQKYIVLDNGDEIEENWHHVATLVEGVRPKHIFLEYIPDNKPKAVTKIISDKGIETVVKDEE